MRTGSLRNGFTLLEMAIVLVIIGLIAGSVVVGKDLYITARDRSVIKEADFYKQGIESFSTKYDQLPGDMLNPAQYWPGEAWSGNGNGDKVIVWSYEGPEAWRQIQLAGFAQGQPFSIACTTNCAATPGLNEPKSSSFKSAGWTIGVNNKSGLNVLMFGLYNDAGKIANRPVLPPKEAFYIDSKMDDGNPVTGNVHARGLTGYPQCHATDGSFAYILTQADAACSIDIAIGL